MGEDGVPEVVHRTMRTVAPTGRPLEFRRVGDSGSRRCPLGAAPAEVRDTVRQRYPRSTVWRVDLHEYPVGDVYVVHASHAEERVEACVAADGTLLGERVLADGEG